MIIAENKKDANPGNFACGTIYLRSSQANLLAPYLQWYIPFWGSKLDIVFLQPNFSTSESNSSSTSQSVSCMFNNLTQSSTVLFFKISFVCVPVPCSSSSQMILFVTIMTGFRLDKIFCVNVFSLFSLGLRSQIPLFGI